MPVQRRQARSCKSRLVAGSSGRADPASEFPASDPLGKEFDYAKEFKSLDLNAVIKDLTH